MSWKTCLLFLCALPFLAGAAGATTTPGGVPIWRTIETDMRQAGCFTPPVATLRDALRSTEGICRFQAVRALGWQGDKKAIPDLKTVHEGDPDPGVRSQAAIELVRMGEREYLEDAHRAMEQGPALSDRVSLAGQLAQVGDASGYPYVAEACRSSVPLDRKTCVSVLRYFIKVAAQDERLCTALVDQMLTLVEDSEAGVRQDAIYTLAGWGREALLPASAISRLEKLAAVSPDSEVQQTAQSIVEHQKVKQHAPKKQDS
jgi:HEAT repeat protein